MLAETSSITRVQTGVSGLDEILSGGLVPERAYMVRGGPGSGKTTLGLHFLTAGIDAERALFINLGESEKQLRQSAELLGFDLANVVFLDLSPSPEFFSEVESYDVFSPADVEREPITREITSKVSEIKPRRVFIDTVTHLRYLSTDAQQFRKQIHSLLRYLTTSGATVLYTSEGSADEPDDDLQYMSDGILQLERANQRRYVEIAKFRASSFFAGQHALILTGEGMQVFPRILPEANKAIIGDVIVASGIPELDKLLHGGLERGTITIISGPSGVGKTTLGLQFMKEAAGRGEHSLIYTFEEGVETITRRAENVHIPVKAMLTRGTLAITAVEPLHFTPDEFAHRVRSDAQQMDAEIIMIDSVSGYSVALQGEDLVTHLHSLCKYLQNRGITVILINEVQDIVGHFQVTDVGISYMADTIIFLRYIELRGQLRRAIGVLKKRLSDFEKTLREYRITTYGIRVGKPLSELRGILTGFPQWGKDASDNHDE